MRETPRSLRIYFGICAALQLFAGLSLLATLSVLGLLLGVCFLGSGTFLGYIAYRLTEMLRTSTRPVTLALGIGVGASLVSAVIVAIMGGGIAGIVFRLLFTIGISMYLYRNVQQLSAEARGGVGHLAPMAPPPGYAAAAATAAAHFQPAPPLPYQAPPSYTTLPTQQPLGAGMQVIVNSPDGRRIPAVILQAHNGQFLCDSQGGQGWVPAHLVTQR